MYINYDSSAKGLKSSFGDELMFSFCESAIVVTQLTFCRT